MAEYRHIKVSGRPIENNTFVEVTILEQTHFGRDFGNSDNVHQPEYIFVPASASALSLGSDFGGPDCFYLGETNSKPVVYLKSYDIERRNETKLRNLPIHLWPKLKKAIEEYNSYYSGEE